MDHPLPLVSVPIERVRIDPDCPERGPATLEQDHLLHASIHARGILDPLQVCDDGVGGYLIIDGERRYQIAENSGYRRLVVVIHRFMTSGDREKLRLELKRGSRPLTRE